MRVLLVGGAGFIGSHLATALADHGHVITILDSLLPQVHGPNAEFAPSLSRIATCVRGDAADVDALRVCLDDQEVIYWLAAETGTGQSMYRVQRYVATNVGALGTLFDLLVGHRRAVRRIVLASSRAVYGEGAYHCPADGLVVPRSRAGRDPRLGWNPACPICGGPVEARPTSETSPPAPTSVYGWTKRAQEELLELLAHATAVERVALRFQNVFGAGQAIRNPYTGVLMAFSLRALDGQTLGLYEDGEIARDFVHVRDVVRALLSAGERRGLDGEVINIGSGVPATIREVAMLIRDAVGSDSPIEVGGQFRVGDIRYAVAALDRARALLGYAPQVSLAEGIRELVAWVRTEEAPPDLLAASERELAERGLLKVARA